MPVHDWTRVDAGDFHDFHQGWVVQLRIALNKGILPQDYYAQVERVAGESTPDILTLQLGDGQFAEDESIPGGPAVLTAPPQVKITTEYEQQVYISKRNRVVIRHKSKRIVAMVELVSWGNKSSVAQYRRFLNKVISALDQGIHLLLIDLHPPTRRDPQGLHGAVSAEIGDESYAAPLNKPLTLAAYVADLPCRAYVEPIAVGDILRSMPIYLTDNHYVLAPLESSYQIAFDGLPPHVQVQLVAAKS